MLHEAFLLVLPAAPCPAHAHYNIVDYLPMLHSQPVTILRLPICTSHPSPFPPVPSPDPRWQPQTEKQHCYQLEKSFKAPALINDHW